MALIIFFMEHLLSAWLWNMGFGRAFLPASWLCFLLLLVLIKAMPWKRAIVWSTLTVIAGFCLFSAIVIGFGVVGLGLTYEPGYPLAPCMVGNKGIAETWAVLVASYTVVEFLFLRATQRWHQLSPAQSFYLALLGNSIAALLLFSTTTCQL